MVIDKTRLQRAERQALEVKRLYDLTRSPRLHNRLERIKAIFRGADECRAYGDLNAEVVRRAVRIEELLDFARQRRAQAEEAAQ